MTDDHDGMYDTSPRMDVHVNTSSSLYSCYQTLAAKGLQSHDFFFERL